MRFIYVALLLFFSHTAHAVDATEREHNLFRQIRCITCQSQSINDSPAPLAEDIRALVKEKISLGKTDEEILEHLASIYGDAVLMSPPFKTKTAFLWYGPLIFVLLGGLVVFFSLRKRNTAK